LEKLVIPIEMTGQQALDQLHKLGSEGKQAGKDIEKGAQDATTAQDSLAGAMRRVNVESMALAAGRQGEVVGMRTTMINASQTFMPLTSGDQAAGSRTVDKLQCLLVPGREAHR
jgi:hypothetical protein